MAVDGPQSPAYMPDIDGGAANRPTPSRRKEICGGPLTRSDDLSKWLLPMRQGRYGHASLSPSFSAFPVSTVALSSGGWFFDIVGLMKGHVGGGPGPEEFKASGSW